MYWKLFKTFIKIGLVTFGGGYAMIPMIEADVVDKNKWVDKDEFVNLVAIAQSCPGVFAINISIFIGYKLRKISGAVCTAIGAALPSFLIILLIAMFFHQFRTIRSLLQYLQVFALLLWLLLLFLHLILPKVQKSTSITVGYLQ